MLSTRLGWFGCLFIAGAMMLGAVLMLSARRDRNRLTRARPPADSNQTVESYQQKAEENESILEGRQYYLSRQ
ncbi:MAG: hypothetical protein JSU73_01965 [candidate division WOR-3 bacterium]|nr:MAG: hypothetical protein JSU73_01965 [candidate division WOR-3 bacterium]